MITLQQLLMTDSDLSGGMQTGKGTDGAQDFLSLLAGALTDASGQGKDAPLTLADLKAAGSKLSKVAKDAGESPPCRRKLPICSRVNPRRLAMKRRRRRRYKRWSPG